MSLELSSEFKLVALACSWPRNDTRAAAIVDLCGQPQDWNAVLALARRHRVEGLVRAGLTTERAAVPAEVTGALWRAGRKIAKRSLEAAAETSRLQQLLAGAGIASLVLKGAAVEWLAYGRLGLKDAWDIDLLVGPSDASRAIEALRAQGYALTSPADLTSRKLATWLQLARECELTHPDTGTVVELHWRLVDGPVLLPHLDIAAPQQLVKPGGGLLLTTFARAELFSYLCVHGAMHGWVRLKWLADVHALIAREAADGLMALHRQATALGAGVCPGQALLLCHWLFGLALPPALAEEIAHDRLTRWLAREALILMAGGGAREIQQRPGAAARILLAQTLLSGAWRGALRQIRYRLIGIDDRVNLDLPRALHGLYPLIRLPSWLIRRAGRRRHGAGRAGASCARPCAGD